MWNRLLAILGLRTRGKLILRCSECNHSQKIDVWCKPGEKPWDAVQREVQAEFERQQKGS